jgi:chemotaxis protein histidine kinase CheA
MITDITVQVQAERTEVEQREQGRAFQHALRDRVAFVQFFADARALVGRIRDNEFADDSEQRRVVHTLKGNSSLFAIESVVNAAHELEQALADDEPQRIADCRKLLVQHWETYAARLVPLLGEDLGDRIELTRAELDDLLTTIRHGASREIIETKVAQLVFEPMRARFNRIAVQLKELARRLKKPEPTVVIKDNGVRLPPNRFAPLWSSCSHLIRNIVDHGLEDPETRSKAGKSDQTQVTLTANETPQALTLIVEDNGRGIDWAAVRDKARAKGLPCSTRHDLVTTLLAPGFSTAASVTATSGRGVGLGAVASAVASLGGQLAIDSEPGRGTRFTFTFRHTNTLNDTASPRLGTQPS